MPDFSVERVALVVDGRPQPPPAPADAHAAVHTLLARLLRALDADADAVALLGALRRETERDCARVLADAFHRDAGVPCCCGLGRFRCSFFLFIYLFCDIHCLLFFSLFRFDLVHK